MSQISVIVPVYNAEPYLEQCINSILRQTFIDFELILIDDGSTDNSGELCDRFAEKDKRILVIHQENRGQAAARNVAVSKAKGKWICFVDSDDCIHYQMLEYLYFAVVNNNVGMGICGAIEAEHLPVEFNDSLSYDFDTMIVTEDVLKYFCSDVKYWYWVVWAKLIRKDIVESVPFEEGRIYEDNAIVFRWLILAKKIAVTNLRMYYYYINYESTSRKKFTVKRLDYLWALEEQLIFYKQHKYKQMLSIISKKYISTALGFYQEVIEQLCDRAAAKKIKKSLIRNWLVYQCYKEIDKDMKNYFYGALFPITMRIYWKLIAAVHKLKTKTTRK